MKVFRSAAEVSASFGPSVVTIGNFDGVHAGHRAIMRRVSAIARERGFVATVLTFDPHPAAVLAPERAPKLLMTVDQRLRALEAEGIDAALVLPFSVEFARLTPGEFASGILRDTLHARVVLVGDDFRFGHRQSGDIGTLGELGAQFGFEVEPAVAVTRRGERISSSAVRRLVTGGAVSKACRMLGAPFALEGRIVKGQGIGSKQTVPTLNLDPRNEVLPKNGVYVTRTRDLADGRSWNSITNIGQRPTFGGTGITVETFLLSSFDGLTPREVEVQFLAFVRDERKFDSAGALKAQIVRDAGVAIRLHRRVAGLLK